MDTKERLEDMAEFLDADVLTAPIEEVEAELHAAGGDPAAIVARNRPAIEAMLERRREAGHPRMTGSTCPCCGEQCERDSVHNGVGMMHGPYGCSSCGYSEWPEYDCRKEWSRGESKYKDGGILDPRGGLTPAGSIP